ncbi:TRAP transporter small permease [Pannonibacter carbonis]|uniref:TRAP transporter small permease n=1 Tax=Pannonibacter carbonis TaxID=2067569 RepID=UPI000D0E39F0|nr:TRAP transporter small permease [Pannonibacter carbonis]
MSRLPREDSTGGTNVPPDAPSTPEPGHTASQTPAALAWPLLVLEVVGSLCLAALLTLTVSDALLRSLANRPVFGASDLIQVLLCLVVAASLPLCVAAGRAIAIDMLVERLPARLRKPLARLMAATSAGLLLLAAWRCFVNAGEAAQFGESTMLLRIGYGPFYLALAISFVFCALLFAAEALRRKETA